MTVTYNVTIKKEYAEAILADLEKMDAVELSKDEDAEVPEWQKEKVRKTRKDIQGNPSLLIDEETAFKMLKID